MLTEDVKSLPRKQCIEDIIYIELYNIVVSFTVTTITSTLQISVSLFKMI